MKSESEVAACSYKGDNDQKHYTLSGQFWEHFQLLEEKRFVKLEMLAGWHWQGIHNAHVNCGRGEEQAPTPGGRLRNMVEKGFNQRHESLLQTVKINVLIISLICRYKNNRQYLLFAFCNANFTTQFCIGEWAPFLFQFQFPCLRENWAKLFSITSSKFSAETACIISYLLLWRLF